MGAGKHAVGVVTTVKTVCLLGRTSRGVSALREKSVAGGTNSASPAAPINAQVEVSHSV